MSSGPGRPLPSGAVVQDVAEVQEGPDELRRSWPQRLVILACLGVIASSIGAALFVDDLYDGVADIGRIEFPGELLQTETPPGEPVNFLIIGLDSALGLDDDDPATIGRVYDQRGTHNADSIALLRVDPVGGQAWAMSIPRDVLVEIPGSGVWPINASSLIGGAPLLVQTIAENFDVPINHYVQLDFLAFREVVEELDGVTMWFPYAARDLETGFNAFEPGCTTLDGPNALAFVRSRKFEQLIDGEWVQDRTAPDLDRIERQQQFVIAALDRAIERGARNPTSLAALIDAAAESVVLDQGLTPAELVDLAEAFTDFDSETLETFSPTVVDVVYERDDSLKLEIVEDLDAEMFQVFRGVADAISLGDIRFSVAGVDEATVVNDTELLRSLGFSVGTERIVASVGADNVIVYPTGGRSEAETLARYVIPVPALVEDPASTEMTLVLGTDHDSISFFFPQDVAETLAAVDALGEVAIPSLSTITSTTTTPPTTAPPADGEDATVSSTSSTTSTTVAPTTTTTSTTVAPAATTTEAPVPGRPPEGETCG